MVPIKIWKLCTFLYTLKFTSKFFKFYFCKGCNFMLILSLYVVECKNHNLTPTNYVKILEQFFLLIEKFVSFLHLEIMLGNWCSEVLRHMYFPPFPLRLFCNLFPRLACYLELFKNVLGEEKLAYNLISSRNVKGSEALLNLGYPSE